MKALIATLLLTGVPALIWLSTRESRQAKIQELLDRFEASFKRMHAKVDRIAQTSDLISGPDSRNRLLAEVYRVRLVEQGRDTIIQSGVVAEGTHRL